MNRAVTVALISDVHLTASDPELVGRSSDDCAHQELQCGTSSHNQPPFQVHAVSNYIKFAQRPSPKILTPIFGMCMTAHCMLLTEISICQQQRTESNFVN